jgi:hypothetical protein
MLGTDGLASMLGTLAAAGGDPTNLVQGVLDRVCVSTPDDDVTVLVARFRTAGVKFEPRSSVRLMGGT